MNDIVYTSKLRANEPLFGKFEHPIKAFIEDESNLCEKQKSILDLLFNVEKSSRFSEAVIGESDFDTFMAKDEGEGPGYDTVQKTFDKYIEHIEFAKEFEITRKMAADAKIGIGANIKNRPRKFIRAYYKTRIMLAAQALIHGCEASMEVKSSSEQGHVDVDLTTGDKKPLFCTNHPYSVVNDKTDGKVQSNYFSGDFTSDSEKFEIALSTLANKLRNFKNENGEVMGYVADVLIIPCNRPRLEMMAKRIIGSERTTGSANNDINTQYGNWTLVVLDGWELENGDPDRFMIMSSEANKNLLGNMFYNREVLDVVYGVDDHTRNMYWNGYCRMGVGFTTWKHMALAVSSDEAVEGTTFIDIATA